MSAREYIYSIMTDSRGGVGAAILKPLLSLISFFYNIASKTVRSFKSRRREALPCKVVSVGNLTLGGTGKTPFTRMLAGLLRDTGHKAAVLTRGYGEDEWKMLKETLDGVPVIVGADRVASGKEACQRFGTDTVVLDDGFQHWRLKRDLDIALVDSTNPFGNRRLFPRGLLREDISGIARADMVVLTKADMGRGNIERTKREIEGIAADRPILESIHSPKGLYDLFAKRDVGFDSIKDTRVCALSSIVNTGYFEYILKNLGARVELSSHYPDHYEYSESDIEDVIAQCKGEDIDTIITTEKDAVKLKGFEAGSSVKILVLSVELKITDNEDILKERLSSIHSG